MSDVSAGQPYDPVSVLVADDDPIFRNLVAARLNKLRGRAVEAEDGSVAWQLLMQQSFDLAIVDLNMPNIDGFGLLQCLRGHPRTRHLPVVVITSQDDATVIEKALSLGATSFMTKPVNWTTFEHHLGTLLRLSASDRRARTSLQLAASIARGQAAIIDKLCQAVTAKTTSARDAIAWAQNSPHPNESVGHLHRAQADMQILDSIARKTQQLSALISDGICVKDMRVPLSHLLAEVMTHERPAALNANVDIVLVGEQAIVDVRCDTASLQVAISELLQNALTHSPLNSTITMSSRLHEDGLLAIDITDQGPGMDPAFVNSILSRAEADGDQSAFQSTMGIGLMLAKTVTEAHGGTLEIRTMLGKGTSATILLPADRILTLSKQAA